MSVIIRVTDQVVEKEVHRETFVLTVHSLSGRCWPDSSEHAFAKADDPLVVEAIRVLTVVEEELDGILEDEHWDELTADYSKSAVQLVYDLIGGDAQTDGDTMASLTGFDVTWFDANGIEYETELEIE